MQSLSTIRKQIKKAESIAAFNSRVSFLIYASDHYTELDREIAERYEAEELLIEFLNNEISKK